MHVQELARLGARIDLKGDTALVHGVTGLRGAQVMATDLRASVSLIIAGLAANGETTIGRVRYVAHGHRDGRSARRVFLQLLQPAIQFVDTSPRVANLL